LIVGFIVAFYTARNGGFFRKSERILAGGASVVDFRRA